MSIVLIVCIAFVVLAVAMKLRRGTFFRWSNKQDVPNTYADRRDSDDRR